VSGCIPSTGGLRCGPGIDGGFRITVLPAVPAGWLIAPLVWLLPVA